MKNLKALWMSILVLLLLFSWAPTAPSRAASADAAPAAGGPIALTITNPLPKGTTVTLTGTKSYTISVPQGATVTRTIDAGKYKYSYLGCLNKAKKGNLKVKGTTAALKIPPCKMATWSFYNQDDTKTATIRLKGWMSYNVSIPPGQLVFVSWVADKYQATFQSCGKTLNFTWKVSGKKGWIIYACK